MRSNRTGGFTLIELLIVIAIIGILAAVLIPNLMRARQVSVDRAAQGYVQNVYTAANAYMAENVQASAAATVDLDDDCSDGAAYGEYSANQPSFTVDSCDVAVDADGSITVSMTYQGGTKTLATIPPQP